MPRELGAEAAAAVELAQASRRVLVELDFSGGVARFTDSDTDITYNGDTFTGVGELGELSAITEGRELSSAGLQMRLSGIDATVLAATLEEQYHGRAAVVYWQYLDNDGQPDGDPVTMFSGFMDTMTIDYSEGEFSVNLGCESRLIMSGNLKKLRTLEEHQARYSGDTFFSFLSELGQLTVEWGDKRVRASGSGREPRFNPEPRRVEP